MEDRRGTGGERRERKRNGEKGSNEGRNGEGERGWIAMIYEDWRPGLKPDSRDASLIASEPHKSSRLPRGLFLSFSLLRSFSLYPVPSPLVSLSIGFFYSPQERHCILFLIFFGPPLSSLRSNYNDDDTPGIIIGPLRQYIRLSNIFNDDIHIVVLMPIGHPQNSFTNSLLLSVDVCSS